MIRMSSEPLGDHDVFVFPGAGSFGGEFKPLMCELGPSARLIRYPGRFGTDFGRPAGSYQDVVASCVAQLRRREMAGPTLVGHSYGAYIAYSTAAELAESGVEVAALVVLGASAPSLRRVPEPATRQRSATAAFLDGVDPGLLSGEWRDVVIDTAMQDLRLLSELTDAECTQVRCPVFAGFGEVDPLTSRESVGRWSDFTGGGVTHRVFPGGHSDLIQSPELASWIWQIRAASPDASQAALAD